MAGALDESFSRLEELEINQIEELASVANLENLTTCSCRGNCLRESGRNFCPCRSLNHYCSSTCHDGNSSPCHIMLEILLKLCDSQSRMMTKYVRMVYCCIAVRLFYIKPKGKKSVLNRIANVYNGYVRLFISF